ncbi:hypothetical protein B0J17DRAFT_706067 [Rhizoctonia solani]|nr:hypothetical protein B0J17DRAFT_706067 [Rhizoctonia solani]
MSSEYPLGGHKKPGLRQTMRNSFLRVKDTIKRPSSPLLSSSDPEHLKHELTGSAISNRFISSLRALEGSIGLFPPLKSAVGEMIGCLDIGEASLPNCKDYEQLGDEFQSMANILGPYIKELEPEPRTGSVANVAQCIQLQVTEIKKQQERGTMGRLLNTSDDQEDVIRRYRQIENLFQQLQCDLSIQTRSDVKKQLEEWTIDPNSAKIYWMNGMVGTGKITIAYNFCEWLESSHRLGASFFCSRISSTCRSLNQIIPTLAYQLARYSPAFRSALCTALNGNPDTGTLNVVQQFEKLVNWPMLRSKDAMPDNVVMVIDALDECDDVYGVCLLLDSLWLKFFVASRPEHVIRDQMISQEGSSRTIVYLHDIEESIVEGDIKKYLVEALGLMQQPPSLERIEQLARGSRNLFIYAATIVRYIHPDGISVDSSARLDSILAAIGTSKPAARNRYKDLDHLYTTVLSTAFSNNLDEDEQDRMRRVLWKIVCAREPVTAATIATLTTLGEHQVWSALNSLQSVVHVPEDKTLISTLHALFPEYMLDKSQSSGFFCDQAKSNKATGASVL